MLNVSVSGALRRILVPSVDSSRVFWVRVVPSAGVEEEGSRVELAETVSEEVGREYAVDAMMWDSS